MKEIRVSKSFIEKIFNEINMDTTRAINSHYVHKKNEENVLISNVTKVPETYISNAKNIVGNTFYSVALPKIDCPFCFDHELDHIPFVMLIEIARQFGIAISHSHYDVPLQGYINMMDKLKFQTLNFVELDLPLLLICEDEILKDKKTTQERAVTFYLYQNNELCMKIESNIIVMKKEIYSRLRTNSRLSIIKNTSLNIVPSTNIQLQFRYNPTKPIHFF